MNTQASISPPAVIGQRLRQIIRCALAVRCVFPVMLALALVILPLPDVFAWQQGPSPTAFTPGQAGETAPHSTQPPLSAEEQKQLNEANRLARRVEELWATGSLREAIPLGEKALKVHQQILGEEHPDCVASLNTLALLYQDTGDLARAEPLFVRAMGICRRTVGERSSHYATSLNNLAVVYHHMGEYAKAERFHLQAMNIRKKVLGEEHADYAQSLHNLAALYHRLVLQRPAG